MPRTITGRDWQARVMADTSSDGTGNYAAGNWIALSTDGQAFDPDLTTLPGEIVTGTLERAQAAYSHTSGTASYTLSKIFTSDQNVTVRKYGVFNAASGGTLVFEELLDEAAILKPGDSVQIVHVVSI